MRYIQLFENFKKSEFLIKKHELTPEQVDFITRIREQVLSGYIGKLTEFYIESNFDERSIQWVADNIGSIKLRTSIDEYKSLSRLIHDIEMAKNIIYINRIRKENNITAKLDINIIADYVVTNNIDISNVDKITISNKIESAEDFIKVINGELGNLITHHKDWDILYEDNIYLVYEILSYEGAIHLTHTSQCIRREDTYKTLREHDVRFFNIIDKKEIDNSIFFDIGYASKELTGKERKIDFFRWNDLHLLRIYFDNIKDLKGYKCSEKLPHGLNNKVQFAFDEILQKIN